MVSLSDFATKPAILCVRCQSAVEESAPRCRCGALGEVRPPLEVLDGAALKATFESRRGARRGPDRSGVWRYRELIMAGLPAERIVTRLEGNTRLYEPTALARTVGIRELLVKHEGENPSGSFKDRGMTAGVTRARHLGARAIACASTGNTSASLAAYGAAAGLPAVVFVPAGKISRGKLVQTLAFGARVLEIDGNFDRALELVQEASRELGMFLLNSVNPWRVEGQKSIMIELMDELDWQPPDWVIFPAGNLGNTSAFGKGLRELKELGLIDRLPRLAAVQAEGSSPFARYFRRRSEAASPAGVACDPVAQPETVATAIRIGAPASWEKAIREIESTNGLVTSVSDAEIMNAKARIDQAGIGCEPASAASLAGLQRLLAEGIVKPDEQVAIILTGHILKDPDTTIAWHEGSLGLPAEPPELARRTSRVGASLEAIRAALPELLETS